MAHSPPSADPFPFSPNIKYEILHEIAQGHVSKVYKAKEIGTGNVLAVKKFMQPERKNQQMTVKIGIRNEVRMLERVRGGPHIIATGIARYLDHPTRMPEIPMKYYKHNLTHLLREPKFAQVSFGSAMMSMPPYYYTFLVQMLAALAFVHGKGIIHRNFQPQNIHYNDTNDFVLADFANAKLAAPPPCVDVEVGMSSEHSSPEMSNSQPQTPAADIWSLGMICLIMLDVQWPGVVKRLTETTWHGTMSELARASGRPELEMMVRLSAHERSTAIQVSEYLENNPSVQSECWEINEDLATSFHGPEPEGGVSEEDEVVSMPSEKDYDGLSQQDLLVICLRDSTSSRRRRVLARKTGGMAEMLTLPGTPPQIRPQRKLGLSSLYAPAPFRESRRIREPSSLTVSQSREKPKRTVDASIAATQQPPPPPTGSQGKTAASSESTVPSPTELRGMGESSRAKAASRRPPVKSQTMKTSSAVSNTAALLPGWSLGALQRVRPSASWTASPPRRAGSGARKLSSSAATSPPRVTDSEAWGFSGLAEASSSLPAESANKGGSSDSTASSTPQPAVIRKTEGSTSSTKLSLPRTTGLKQKKTWQASSAASLPPLSGSRKGMEASCPTTTSAPTLKGLEEGVTSSDASAAPPSQPTKSEEKATTALKIGEYHLKPGEDEGGWQQPRQKSRRKVQRPPPHPKNQRDKSSRGAQLSARPAEEARAEPFKSIPAEAPRHNNPEKTPRMPTKELSYNVDQSRGSLPPAEEQKEGTTKIMQDLLPAESSIKTASQSQPTQVSQQAAPSSGSSAGTVPPRQTTESPETAGSSRRPIAPSASITPSSQLLGSRDRAAASSTTTFPLQNEVQGRGGPSSATAKPPLPRSIGPNGGGKSSSSIAVQQLPLPTISEDSAVPSGSAKMSIQQSIGESEATAGPSSSPAESLQESISASKALRAQELLRDLEVLRAKADIASAPARVSGIAQTQSGGQSCGSSREPDYGRTTGRREPSSQKLSADAPAFYPYRL